MKKILITATAGGFVPQFELNNVKLLQEDGYEVHYAANFDNHIYQWHQEELEKQQVMLHHVAFENSLLDFRAHRKAFHRLVDMMHKEQIDVVHCHTPFASVLTRLAAIHSKRDIYVIYTSHGFHFYEGASIKNWLFYPIEKHLSKKTDVLITINQEDYQRARQFSTRVDKRCRVARIPGVGLDTERFRPKGEMRQWIREKYEVPKGAFHLVTIGELSTEKNIAVIITALRQLRHLPIYYSIFGKGPQMLQLSEYIKACGMEDKIKLRGYTTEAEVVLQSADAFVFPSIREGLGMAALEAMACGVPVIAYDNRGTREYMQHGVNGLVCKSGEPMEYIEHISKMYDLYQQCDTLHSTYRHMQTACRQTAEAFCVEKTEQIMREIYQSVR